MLFTGPPFTDKAMFVDIAAEAVCITIYGNKKEILLSCDGQALLRIKLKELNISIRAEKEEI